MNDDGMPRPRHMRQGLSLKAFAWMLIIPVLAFFAIWNVVPFLWLLGLSFYRYYPTFGQPPKFLGLGNYISLMNDPNVWERIGTTFLFMVSAVGIETGLGLVLGFVFWSRRALWGRRLALTLLFSPMVLAPVAAGTFFRLIYDPLYGVVPYYIHMLFGVPKPNLLGNSHTAMWAVLATDVWMWTPFMTMMTIAALGAIPKSVLEAASVDRLKFWQRVRYVMWPYGKFILLLGVILRTIDAFKTYGLISAMTAGGPGNATDVLSITLYREGFVSFDMGTGSALALFTLFIAVAFTSVYLYFLKNRESEAVS
ncbi:MAG: sugar ABC transporter permease [Thermaerobacter sp.]|nr:sugar ABC transporter permease [Thermaerobacter sp.]